MLDNKTECKDCGLAIYDTQECSHCGEIKPMIKAGTEISLPKYPKNTKYTFFVDIDGTIINEDGDLYSNKGYYVGIKKEKLPYVNKLNNLHVQGHKIILVTGRPSTYRDLTETVLKSLGIYYDQLIMDCGNGLRVLINDSKEKYEGETAFAYTVEKNQGLPIFKIEE